MMLKKNCTLKKIKQFMWIYKIEMYFNVVLKNDKNFDFMQIVACKLSKFLHRCSKLKSNLIAAACKLL